jgi:cytochrome oxidase Cu insertion factor (SCO1/SenC/PrrC family)
MFYLPPATAVFLLTHIKRNVAFVLITVDPGRDTPEVLARYALLHGANPAGLAFLTGTPDLLREARFL